ncbi:MAG: sigma 54-interacting transcriptional regulator, partial [Myxococcota bacterium]
LDLLGRGDIATVLAYPSAEEDLEQILQAVRKPALAGRGRAPSEDDLVPRILCVGNLEGAYLVRQFNQRRIFRALPLNVETSRLRSSVEEAIRDYGVRTEQRRATIALQRALARNTSRRDRAPRSGLASQMVLESLAMRRVLELTRVAAPHRVTVLLEGETGVGKDVMARIIHELSDRSQSAFVVQDCGTLSETLMESELFGHVKGAFTSAVSNHPGIFALADGGTVFLDEIENTSPAMQAKLLRVLETGQIRPVGGTRMRTVDVRLIVASNRDLRNEVSLGRFREDLFYRVNTFPITVPALRERPDDIVPLSERFIELANQSLNKSALGIDEEASRALRSYPWPGNIRELRNVIERAVLL